MGFPTLRLPDSGAPRDGGAAEREYRHRSRNGARWREWFAMPHVPRPDRDPLFAPYFKREWHDALVLSLRNFLATVFASAPPPKLLLLQTWHSSQAQRKLREELQSARSEREALEDDLQRTRATRDRLASTLRDLLVAHHHGHRASRLDSAQYAALHNLSAAHRMFALLPTEDFQKAERLALDNADASLLTVAQACALLGIAPQDAESASPGLPCPAASRTVQEAELEVMQLKADDAALLLAFARVAALRSTMLSYDLGEATKRKQALAVCQRLLLPLAPDEDPCVAVQTRLPKHASVLYCCSECRRVVNSVQDGSGKEHPFNELGLSASMLAVGDNGCNGHMRCAKRSSAALRTAVALEASAEQLELEQLRRHVERRARQRAREV